MITRVPNISQGRAPRLSTLLQYLENDANKKREDALYIDGFNAVDIESESYYKDYWHGIIAPS